MNTTPEQFARQIEPGLTHRILIVEDDAILVTHLEQTLIQIGYQVSGLAATGEAAIEMALAQKPDAILMDIQLPEISGLEVTNWLKEDDDLRHIPVVAVTAFAMKGDEEVIRQGGCEAYISKPISVASFLDTVRRFIG